MILTLQTSAFSSYGGIATYNRLVCRAMNDFGEADEKYVLLSGDSPADVEPHGRGLTNLHIRACNGSRQAFALRAYSLALRKRIDLVLVGHVNYAPLALWLKKFQPELRYGVIMYGIDVWKNLPRLRRRALQAADFMISISEYTKRRAVAVNQVMPKKVYLLPNALEWDEEEPETWTASTKLPLGTRLLTVSRLDRTEKYKGVDTVIEALPTALAHVPDLQYIIVGSGSDATRLKRLVERIGVGSRVHFLGSVDDDTLRTCYRASDVFVMPSAKEGFGFVFLEAMQYGKPVIAANEGGSPEVVTDGVTGLLVQYGNVPQLSRSITRLCLDPELRRTLGRAGYEYARAKFTFPQFKQTLTRIIKRELPSAALYRAHIRTLFEDPKAS